MVPWQFSRNEFRRRPGRNLLTLGSVAIGVATLLAVSVSSVTTHNAFREMYQTLAGRAALEVRAEGGDSFEAAEVLKTLDAMPEIKAAVPVFQRPTVLFFHSQRMNMLVLGIDPEKDRFARDYFFEEGNQFPHGNEVLLEAGFARNIGAKVGDEVSVLTSRGPRRLKVIGLLASKGAAAFQGGSILFVSLPAAQTMYRARGQVDSIYLVLNDEGSEDKVAGALAGRLPPGIGVHRPAMRSEMARETLLTTEQGLNIAGALSLVAAVFIIINAFFMNLTERRRQLATLRAIGATRRQILGLVLREGLLLGIVGTGLGIVLGIFGAGILAQGMERLFQTKLPPTEVAWWAVAEALVLGPLLSLAAVAIPAVMGSRVSPLEGMRPVPAGGGGSGKFGWAPWIGLGMTVAAAIGGILIHDSVLPPPTTAWVLVLALVGMTLIKPVILVPIVWLVARPMEWLLGVEARLACRQILRQRTRSALTAGVLFVVVVTGVGMGNSVLNNIQDVRSWIRRTIVCDFVIRVMMPSMTGAEAAELPENVLPDVRAVPGVTSVETIAFATAESEGRPLVLVIRSFPRDAPFSLDLRDLHGLTPEEVHQRLLAGEVVLSTVLAQRMGKAPGDELTLSTKNGTQRVRIAATNTDYIVGGSVVYISSDTAAKLLGVRRVQGLLIRIDPQRRAAVETRLAEIARQSGALLHSMTDVTNVVENLMSGIVAAMWALLASGFVVAAFGVINTLTMNVLEQTRELGLLRVVAMTRYQVRNYIFAQAAVIGIVGLLPGAVVGEVIAYIINLVTYPLLGHPIDFAFRPEVIATCLAVAFLITIAAAYLPSERAARLGITEAIQYE